MAEGTPKFSFKFSPDGKSVESAYISARHPEARRIVESQLPVQKEGEVLSTDRTLQIRPTELGATYYYTQEVMNDPSLRVAESREAFVTMIFDRAQNGTIQISRHDKS